MHGAVLQSWLNRKNNEKESKNIYEHQFKIINEINAKIINMNLFIILLLLYFFNIFALRITHLEKASMK